MGRNPVIAGAATLAALLCFGCSPDEPAPVESPYEDRSDWPVRELRDEPFDVLHYRVSLDLDETTKSMDGTVEISLQAEADISEVELDAETYEVRAVRAGGEALDFTHEGGTLAITLGAALPQGETLVLEIDYGGSDIDVDATQYGMAANYDLGLDFKAETDANPQLINTLSFPEGARHWYPSVDHPADRATFELLATVREDWKVLSNGRLLGISEGARPGTRTHHWRLDEPHPTYLSVLVAGPYEVIEDFHGDIPVNYWVYPQAVRTPIAASTRRPRSWRSSTRSSASPIPGTSTTRSPSPESAAVPRAPPPPCSGRARSTTSAPSRTSRATDSWPTRWRTTGGET